MKRNKGFLFTISINPPQRPIPKESEGFHPYHCSLAAMVRVERCGKSAPVGWEQSDAVNSIRSNTGMGAYRLARPLPGWLERAGNGTSR